VTVTGFVSVEDETSEVSKASKVKVDVNADDDDDDGIEQNNDAHTALVPVQDQHPNQHPHSFENGLQK